MVVYVILAPAFAFVNNSPAPATVPAAAKPLLTIPKFVFKPSPPEVSPVPFFLLYFAV